jgi:hypothetical protein
MCSECGKPLPEEVLRRIIRRRLEERQEQGRKNKEHISNYATFAIREELIKAFEDAQESP